MKKQLSFILPAVLLALTKNTLAGQTPEYCEMIGSLARGITQDRDRGVSYNAELGKIKGATQDLPSGDEILVISLATIKTVYLDMPKITPEGAYKLNYLACITAK
jgi:hypothetical protein